jgi:hypothetical protein
MVATDNLFAQTNVESRVQKLEETIQALERRIAALEEQLQEQSPPSNVNSANASWRRLQKGMTAEEVEKLLGSPSKINEYGSFAVWSYNSPSGYGSVRFRGNPRALESWSEP